MSRPGALAVAAGSALLVSQLFRERPWQAAIAVSLLAIFLGALAVSDERHRRLRAIERHRRGRPGYLQVKPTKPTRREKHHAQP